jgi:hypothetical protein
MIWAIAWLYITGAAAFVLFMFAEIVDDLPSDAISWSRCLLVTVLWPIMLPALILWAVIMRATDGRP